MKWKLVIIFVWLIVQTQAQTRAFLNAAREALETKDQVTEIDEREAEPESFDILSDETLRLEELFLSELKDLSRSKPDQLKKSQTLTTLAQLATQSWKGSHYSDAKKWRKLSKHFKRSSNRCASRFNLMKEVSFRVSLIDNHGKRFYYDRLGSEGGLNLYSGTKPRGTKEREETEQIPLESFSEEELIEQFVRQVSRKRILSDLKRGRIAYAGLSVQIDERSLYKNRIPTARIVLIVGARRLKDIRVKKKST